MLCKCINVNLRNIEVKQKSRSQLIQQANSNSWKICLGLSEKRDPTKVYRFETNVFMLEITFLGVIMTKNSS